LIKSVAMQPTGKCPELNPQNNVWPFVRDNSLYNHVFDNDNALIDQCAVPRTNRKLNPGPSCLSECAIRRFGSGQRSLAYLGEFKIHDERICPDICTWRMCQ